MSLTASLFRLIMPMKTSVSQPLYLGSKDAAGEREYPLLSNVCDVSVGLEERSNIESLAAP